ncbi:hypothetical protein EYB25_001213 [Talaromyces marneffei]|uniref:uncharacterized protein n=1 Tax=Talaromyces marneffei TaxID=37727 RepID=UPI0012A7C738|nr:uncharacterized protein EYB26_001122 [Talaromyces marneffei]KAE8556512.1 hypothetical protein EYB25_001213 [Talaromyces marneffei]QGA13472.1 hypothetical protein EYB26_001122 [Talaromyces marneffei]
MVVQRYRGLRGIDPAMDKLISIEGLDTYNGPSTRESPAYPRILQAFENTRMIAESVGAKVGDCLRLVMQDASHIYVGLKQSVANDFVQLHNGTCTGSINEAQKAIWGESRRFCNVCLSC